MRLLPREERFFQYFLDQVKLITEASALLLDGARGGNSRLEESVKRIKELEMKGDSIIHEFFTKLNQTFITPLDPEDLHSLSSHLDDVLDGIEDAAHRLHAYHLEPAGSVIVELCEHIVACAKELQLAFVALNENQKLLDHCIEINRLEEVVDHLVRKAVSDLFDHETDPIRIIKLKEVYEFLELTTDRCEDVADTLQNVVVKNS